MRDSIVKTAIVVALLAPTLAMATFIREYDGNSASDSFDFVVDLASTVSVGYSWSDFHLTRKKHDDIEGNAASLTWRLTGAQTKSGSFSDLSDALDGHGILDLGKLTGGSYHLSFKGLWDPITVSGSKDDIKGWSRKDGHVYLYEDSLKQVAVKAPVATVSEPGSYALLVGGLGLMGFVARRRTTAKGA